MAAAETAKLLASLTLQDNFTPTVRKALTGLGQLEGGVNKTRLVLGALGSVAGLGFAIAAKGAAELDAATRQFQADTGATAEEAAKASTAIAEMYRGNLQGFDQIGATLSKVTTDLGLSGKAAEETTRLFLDFATATGTDAAQGVAGVDNALDAWNLTAADSQHVLDELVASHQKYGGSVTENLDALSRLAPAMQALGSNIDDTIGLLNLFETSGLDSTKATQALNQAVKKLQPGQTINDLVAQIASIEDPTKRAQAAIEIFGARGGVGLANALRPGIRSLQDFVPTANDVTDATTKAADAVKSGFGAQFQLIIKNAGGALAEFGTNFGPLLLGASLIGPKMAAAITTGFGAVAGLLGPKLISMMAPAIAAAGLESGTALGTAIAAAVPLGLAALAAIPVVITFEVVTGDINRQVAGIEKKTAEFVQTATLDGLKRAKEGLESQLRSAGQQIDIADLLFLPSALSKALGPGGLDITGTKAAIQRQIDAIDAAIAKGEPRVAGAASDVARALPSAIKKSTAQTRAAGYAAGAAAAEGVAKGITDARQKPLDAFNTLVEMLKHPLTKTGELARLAGELTSKELAAGLKSADPAIRAQAEAVRDEILSRIEQLKPGAGIIGKATTQAIADGLKSKDPQVRANAQKLKEIIETALRPLPESGTKAGQGVVDNLAAYLQSPAGKQRIYNAILSVIRLIQRTIGEFTSNPTAPTSTYTSNDRFPGKEQGVGAASGFLGTVTGATRMIVGEAGRETVAVLANPRTAFLRPPSLTPALVRAPLAVTVNVAPPAVTSRDITRASHVSRTYGGSIVVGGNRPSQ